MALLKDIMTTHLVLLKSEDSMDKVAEIFAAHKIHHLPVINTANQLIGIISQTDFERMQHGTTLFRMNDRSNYNQALLRATRVTDVMTKNIVELGPNDPLEKAYQVFKKNKFRCLPIVDNGKLLGMVTPLDLLDYFFKKISSD